MLELGARRPWTTLLIAGLLTGVAGIGATFIEAEVDFVATVPPHDGLEPYRELLDRLEGVRFVAIYMAKDPSALDFRTPEGFDSLVAEQADLAAHMGRLDGVSHMLSAHELVKASHHMTWKIATAGNAPEDTYSVPEEPAMYGVVRDRALSEPSLDDVVARDGSSALMLVFFDVSGEQLRGRAGAADVALREWAADASNHPVSEEHQLSGLLWSRHATDQINVQDMQVWGTAAAAVAAVVLGFVLRRPSNVLIAGAALATALVWTAGAIGFFGIPVSFLTLFLSPIVAGIGIDHAVHILHRFEEERMHFEPTQAMVRALGRTGPAVTLAALTTAGGLSVLMLVPNPLFAQVGGLAALGIVFAWVASLTVVPALRVLMPPGQARAPASRMMRRVINGLKGPRAPVIAVLIVTVAAVVAAAQTRIESGSAENEFPQDDPLIVLQQRIEQEYGAFQRGYLIVQGDMADAEALQALHAATRAAVDVPLARAATSVTDLLLADEATNEGAADIALSSILAPTPANRSESERLPQDDAAARDALEGLFNDPLWRTLAPFTITRDLDLAVVAVTLTPWEDQSSLVSVRDTLRAHADALQSTLGPDYDVAAGGAPINRAAVIEQTPKNVALATGGTTLAVLGILAFAWRAHGRDGRLVAGVAACIVLGAAILVIATVPVLDALYGWTGGNNAALNDMFLLGLAVVVAVGVDDVVHLAQRFWEARALGFGTHDAISESAEHAGRAILGTTLTTASAFAVLGFSYFLQSKNLAILTATGVLSALLLTLLLVPWILAKHQRVTGPS